MKDSAVRIGAAGALGELGTARAIEPLITAMQAEDLEIIAGAYRFFIRKGERDSEPILIMALNEYGFREMAQAFLNCGNNVLEEAATEWAGEASLHYHAGNGERGRGTRMGRWSLIDRAVRRRQSQ